MGKLRTLSGDEVCRILESYGFRRVRVTGSHAIMQKRADPVPLHKELRKGTLQSIIRQSGLLRTPFESAL